MSNRDQDPPELTEEQVKAICEQVRNQPEGGLTTIHLIPMHGSDESSEPEWGDSSLRSVLPIKSKYRTISENIAAKSGDLVDVTEKERLAIRKYAQKIELKSGGVWNQKEVERCIKRIRRLMRSL